MPPSLPFWALPLAIEPTFLSYARMGSAGETEAWADPAGPDRAALHHGSWRGFDHLSSTLARVERFLGAAGFDRAPWLAVAFMAGIFAWFSLPALANWLALLAGCLALALGVAAGLREDGRFPFLRQAGLALSLALAAGCATVWVKSALVGTAPIARPWVGELTGTVLSRAEQVAQGRVRLVLATREPGAGRAVRVRLNLPLTADRPGLAAGAKVRLRARLLPPSPPMPQRDFSAATRSGAGGAKAAMSMPRGTVKMRASSGLWT
ncbi:MAG TPA: metal-binding protein, partial [Novosphingobium sp.]|nr:metal-binding protein [Novosphingobium sp.]